MTNRPSLQSDPSGGVLVAADFAEEYGGHLRTISPSRPVVIVGDDPLDADQLAAVSVANLWLRDWARGARPYLGAVTRCPNLRWFHTASAGVDSPVFGGLVERGVRLTTSSGAAAPAIAQHVIMTMLALARDLPGSLRAQTERRWRTATLGDDLVGASVVVVGLGPIGLEVARLAVALGMSVTGLRRRPPTDEGYPVRPLEALDEVVASADWIVLALPLAEGTAGIFSADLMARCRPGARVVNIGRGGLLDEPALLSALRSGAIGGAALDVFSSEPLPEDSPFWGLPNVIVTPHSSAAVPSTRRRQAMAFLDNLVRYETGEPLHHEVQA